MADIKDTKARIDAMLAKEERRIAIIFEAAIRNVKENLDLEKVADLIERGQLEEALLLTKEIADRLGLAAQASFISSAESTSSWIASAGVATVVFDQTNDWAVDAMRGNKLRLITDFTAEQRKATRRALIEGITRGANPIEQARAFRSSIGLTETQAGHVINYRRALERVGSSEVPRDLQRTALQRALRDKRSDSAVKAAIKQSKKLTPKQIDSMVARYEKRYVKYRSEVISRTEALTAVHQGTEEAFRQGAEQGSFRLDELERTWDSSGDGRVRNTHRALDGEVRDFGKPWTTPNGTIHYPGDPSAPAAERIQCRCVILTRVKKSALT